MRKSFLAAAAALALQAPAAASIAVFHVSTPQQLAALLPTLRQASEVRLAPGDYGQLFLRHVNPPADVVIRSADDAAPAVFRILQVRDSSRLRFDSVVFNRVRAEGEPDTVNSLMIRDSRQIRVTGSRFFSNLNGDPFDDGYLMRIMNSEDVLVLDSDFRDGRIGILVEWSRGVLVASSRFSDLREGINFAGGERLRVERSYFTRISPLKSAGDHSDCIQVYQMRDASPARDIQFTNNVMIPVNPSAQGLFIRNSLDPERRHQNVRVVNNLYFGSMRQGIAVTNTDGALVSGNSVLTAPDVTFEPGVTLSGSLNVRFERTMAPLVIARRAEVERDGIVSLRWTKNPGGVLPQDQVVGSLAQTVPDIEDFRVREGSAAHAAGAGFNPVPEIGDVPDAEREGRYAWYALHFRALTVPPAPAASVEPAA